MMAKTTQKTTPLSFAGSVLAPMVRADQIDILHLSVTNLLEMVRQNEVDIILDQPAKNVAQKKGFVQKIVESIESPELHTALQKEVDAGNLEFFRERSLETVLTNLQREAEQIEIVHLRVAVPFKPEDVEVFVSQLSTQLEKKVALDLLVDKSLIGGAILQYGIDMWDYSVKTHFQEVATQWREAIAKA